MEKITLPTEALNQEPPTKKPEIDIDRLSSTLETAWREQGKELFPCATDGCKHLVLKTGETCWDCQMKSLDDIRKNFERDDAERKKKHTARLDEINKNYKESVRKINENSAKELEQIENDSAMIAIGVAGGLILGALGGYLLTKK
jgi:hypothetical protein